MDVVAVAIGVAAFVLLIGSLSLIERI